MHAWTTIRTARLIAALSSSLALAACSTPTTSDIAGAQSASAEAPVPTDTPTPTPTATATQIDEQPSSSIEYHYKNSSGYKQTVRILLWKPVTIAAGESVSHPMAPADVLGSVCDYDPTTDVIIPGEFEVTGDSKGFDTPANAHALFVHNASQGKYLGTGPQPFEGDDRLDVEQYFSAGPECSNFSTTNIWGYGHSNALSVQWASDLPSGQTDRSAFAIVIHKYRSPAAPDGDKALLDYVTIRGLAGNNTDATKNFSDADCAYLGFYSCSGLTLSGKLERSS